jgi:hypothetical protein
MMRQGWKRFKASGLTARDVARHVAFTQDFMYQKVDSAPLPDGGRSIWINDLEGARTCRFPHSPSGRQSLSMSL